MAASAFDKAKELKHKIDDALEAHPIEHRAPAENRASDKVERANDKVERANDKVERTNDEAKHALAKFNELAHGTNALEVVGHDRSLAPVEHVDSQVDERVRTHVGTHLDTHVGAHVDTTTHDREVDAHVEANERAIARDLDLRANANTLKHDEELPSVDKLSALVETKEHHVLVTDDETKQRHVLMADGSAYNPEPRIDETVQKGLKHEREALADARHIVEKVAGEAEPAEAAEAATVEAEMAENKKLAAEKVREGDPTIDRRDGAAALDAAYQSEVVAKALELRHQLDHHLESEALHEEERKLAHHEDERAAHDEELRALANRDPSSRESRESRESRDNKRVKVAEVEPVPTTSEEIHRERALFAGGAAWVVGGLAAVVLGILALAGVARPFVLVEIAFLVAGASILVSSLLNGARVIASHQDAEREGDDVDDAVAQQAALHAHARERRVELHRSR